MSVFDKIKVKKIISFASDNYSGVHPDIMNAIVEANAGQARAYGEDDYTLISDEIFKKHFGKNIEVYYVFNGTAANVLGLKAITESFHSIICAETAHINGDECGAPERFTGCKLLTIPSQDGKITVEQIKKYLYHLGNHHRNQPKVISITQPTEYGTLYSPSEIRKIADYAHENNLFLHMDGARLSNASSALNLSLKEITKDVGVDVLSFGGTKNGIMSGETVIFFDMPDIGYNFKFIRKQGMQLVSKMRYISAQFIAFLSNDLWLKNATHANQMARLLEEKLKTIPAIKITQKVETNSVFAIMPEKVIPIAQEKYPFYMWNPEISEVRFMTSFDTEKQDIENFVNDLKGFLAGF